MALPVWRHSAMTAASGEAAPSTCWYGMPTGSLATSMATTGYDSIQAFQKAEIMFAPALQTEGKKLQREQAIGMSR